MSAALKMRRVATAGTSSFILYQNQEADHLTSISLLISNLINWNPDVKGHELLLRSLSGSELRDLLIPMASPSNDLLS